MKAGIVGLPNAGKSTLFNALTRAGAQAAEYPFTTVDPNVAIVPVPDPRLDAIGEALGIAERVPEQIEFVDIAGLARGAHAGEGLGNRFLGHIRDVDAVLHVVRAFENPQVAHPQGDGDPLADLEAVETELLLADLESARRRLESAEKSARSNDKGAIREAEGWRATFLPALAGSFVAMITMQLALTSLKSGVAAVLLSMTPIFSIPVEWKVLGQKPSAGAAAGAVIAIAGVWLLTAG